MLYNRVLITGANGLVGQELVRRMSQLPEYDVLATGRQDGPRFTASCGYTRMDITDREAVGRIFTDFAPNVVVNCAAMTQVDDCERERDACWEVNVEAVEHITALCRRHGSRIVQVSTDFIFDGQDGPYSEDARPAPVNYYGRSKLAAENAVRDAGRGRWAIARTVLVFGTGEQLSRSNIALWVRDKLQAGEPIRIVTDQFRTPTYSLDLAVGLERLVRFGKSGVFHMSGRDYVSIHEFAHLVADVFDLDASLISPTDASEFSQTAERPPETGFIILKAETELGYKPRSLRVALEHLAGRLGATVSSSENP